jgi:phage shock protein E
MKKPVIIFLALLLVILTLASGGCEYITGQALNQNGPLTGTGTLTTPQPAIIDRTPEEAYVFFMISSFRIILIDVRTAEEYSAGHLQDAVNIDYYNQQDFVAGISKMDVNAHYIVYCASGRRSALASQIMMDYDFKHITNVTGGGYTALKTAGFPVVE